MAKNIVILCDGTSNEVSGDRTNILRLFGTLKKSDEQLVYYDPGVGTFGAEHAASYTYRRAVEIWGLLTGWGLDQNVKEAYRFICDHYDDGKRKGRRVGEPDRLYFFGFSRGAYTVRVLAGFLHTMGLIPKENLNLLDYAYRAYKDIGVGQDGENTDIEGTDAFAEVNLFQRMLRPLHPTIALLGLFDTVGSVIESGRYGPRFRSHAYTATNRSVSHVRHAVAIDERRTLFRPQLWLAGNEFWPVPFQASSALSQDVREVWFSGSHADVGGGYPEEKSALAKIPLAWMIKETKPLGLLYKTRTINTIVLGKDESRHYVKPDPLAAPNDSMTWAWKILEIIPRRRSAHGTQDGDEDAGWYLPLGQRRTIPEGADIHGSVFARRGTQADYAQPNIPVDHVVV